MTGVVEKTENIPMMCVELNFDFIPMMSAELNFDFIPMMERTDKKSRWT
jgi:hypothetical protein